MQGYTAMIAAAKHTAVDIAELHGAGCHAKPPLMHKSSGRLMFVLLCKSSQKEHQAAASDGKHANPHALARAMQETLEFKDKPIQTLSNVVPC
jgi:hypothetical protein